MKNIILFLSLSLLFFSCNIPEKKLENKDIKVEKTNDSMHIIKEKDSEQVFLDSLFVRLNKAGFNTVCRKHFYIKSPKKLAHILLLDSSLLINNIGVDRYRIDRIDSLKSSYEKKIAVFRGGVFLELWKFQTSEDAHYFFSNTNINQNKTPLLKSYIYKKIILSFTPKGGKKTDEFKNVISIVEDFINEHSVKQP